MDDIKLTIGTVVDVTGDAFQALQAACYEQAGRSTRFAMGTAATGLADFYRQAGNDLAFRTHDGREGEWRYWTGRYWSAYHGGNFRKDLSHLVGETINGPQIDILEKTMKLRAAVKWQDFDRHPVLTLENCTLRLDGKELKADAGFDKGRYSTFELPLAWAAAPTPSWDAMLARMLPNEADRRALQEVFGAAFFPSFQMQTVAALVGKAGSGKSTVTGVLRDMLGGERVSAIQTCQLSGEHYLAGLVGKFVNLDAESEFVEPEDEVLLKRISGGDPVTINQKNKPVYEAVLPVKWVMVCEELPKFSSKTDGFWSRLVIVPFDVPIPADQQLPMEVVLDQLRPEYHSIFHWAMRGLKRLLSKPGTRGGAFSRSERSAQILVDHRNYSNPITDWLEQFVVPDPDGSEERQAVYDHYRNRMSRGGQKPVAQPKFNKALEERGFESRQPRGEGGRKRVWHGLRLVSD